MYAVLVRMVDKDGREAAEPGMQLLYGPYKTASKAEEVRMNLQEQALCRGANIEADTMPLVRSGLIAMIEETAHAEG